MALNMSQLLSQSACRDNIKTSLQLVMRGQDGKLFCLAVPSLMNIATLIRSSSSAI